MTTATATRKRAAQPLIPPRLIDAPVLILGAIAAIGVVAGLWRMATGLGATTSLTDEVPWGIWIGFDFTLIALSGAAFTMAGLVYIFRQSQFKAALRSSVLTGLLGYMAVLVLLVLDLGRPDRFYHFIIFWNLHSPLFEICWCVLLYTTVLTIEVSPQILEKLNKPQWAHRVHSAIVPVAIVAVTLSSLHQSTLGTLYLNMPHRLTALWYTPILPVLFFVSAVMAGLSMAATGYRLAARGCRQPAEPRVFSGLAHIAGWVGLVYAVLKVGEIFVAGEGGLLLSGDIMSRRMWLELALVIVPVILLLAPKLRQRPAAEQTGVLLLLGHVLLNRFNATLFAQAAPSGSIYNPHPAEWLSTIGVLAAAALAWLLGVRILSMFEKPGHRA
jgi:Ni/Fe-hydrogenase subunit HybB-like protein